MEENLGRIISGWKIIREIGRGGFGCVYEVEKESDFGAVAHSALKVISIPESDSEIDEYRLEGYDDVSMTALFKSRVEDITSEFRLMSKLKGCSNIVSFEDHWIVQHELDPGYNIYIRMELLTPLMRAYERELIEKGHNDSYVQRVGIDICRALERCARHNIIHRDIKPQNILVNEEGDFKLGDFGIAKTSDHTTRATKTGTFSYMAPEVYLSKPYNASVDIYSLGLVMYWMLNERRGPFLPLPPQTPTTQQAAEALERRMRGDALPAPKHGSEDLKRIVLKACTFDPKERYANPTEMKRELECVMKDTASLLANFADTVADDSALTVDISGKRKAGEVLHGEATAHADRSEKLRTEPVEEGTIGVYNTKISQSKHLISEKDAMDVLFKKHGEQKKPIEHPKESVPQKSEKTDDSASTGKAKKKSKLGLFIGIAAGAVIAAAVAIVLIVGSGRVAKPATTSAQTTMTAATTKPAETPTYTPSLQTPFPTYTSTPDAYAAQIEEHAEENGIGIITEINMNATISAGRYHTVVIQKDGTVKAVGYNKNGQCDLSEWTDIVSVAAGYYYTVGLKSDGTAVAVGYNENGQCEVTKEEWRNLVAISAQDHHTVGLREDGTVVACGSNQNGECNVSEWTDITAIAAGGNHTVGLKNDGTVVAIGSNTNGECDVSTWSDIVMIGAGWAHTVGLTRDGKVVATGKNMYEQCNVSDWTDIVAVAAGGGFTLGLAKDGTVVVTGFQEDSIPFPKLDWSSVAEISAGGYHALALKTDGTLYAAGNNSRGQCDVYQLTGIHMPG